MRVLIKQAFAGALMPLARKHSQHQNGYSLIELMLACALGLFLMLGLMQIYLNVYKSLELQSAINQVQENGRFASHFLQQTLQTAGEASCVNPLPFVNQELAIHGYQADLPDFLKSKVIKGTDSFIIGRCRLEDGHLKFIQYAYFIGKTSRKNNLGEPILALYEAPINGNKQELVANIDNMKLNYGIASNDDKNIEVYLPAAKVQDWTQVRVVEVSLLLSSESAVLTKSLLYSFGEQSLGPSRLLHKEWNITIGLRERLS